MVLTAWLGVGRQYDRRIRDAYFVPDKINTAITLVTIDDESIKSLGLWPLPRSVYAKVLNNLASAGAKVVGFDVTLSEKSREEEDIILESVLTKIKIPVILAGEGKRGDKNEVKPLPEFIIGQVLEGKVNIKLDSDGVLRRMDYPDSFAAKIIENSRGKMVVPAEELLINYLNRPGSFASLSLAEVYSGSFPAGLVRGRTILIGATATDLHDNWLTPISNGKPMSGVEVHANIISQVTMGKFLREKTWIEELITLFILGLICGLIGIWSPIWLALVLDVLILVLFGYVSFVMFDMGINGSLLYPILTVWLVFLGQSFYRYFLVARQKAQIRRALSFYLSAQVMKEVLSNPKSLHLGGQKRLMTVLFSDIAGFTSLSEKIDPEKLTEFLNNYLDLMTGIVFENGGVLDKYIGDAVMAFWGAPLSSPNQADQACLTALAMQEVITQKQPIWQKEYGVDLGVRIGINSGEMVVGNMGSNVRFDYTVLGDNVNLGSRLEGINKQYGTKVVISESTLEALAGKFVVRKLDRVAVKGKSQGIMIYELRGVGEADKNESKLLEEFEVARGVYEAGKFGKARTMFAKLVKEYSADGPSGVYLARCTTFEKEPPKEWNGVYHAESK